ncbi:uncharacterized protein LOC119573456 [Penaeus monodon]|uniref:uncharacterized protein LOC119573456 n=1 Tax=Penaeus monodon TaxID=6687 RepID=UPI0018A732AE|nr:uncharacterized protein LOC119573456 [Penaeus monodon]
MQTLHRATQGRGSNYAGNEYQVTVAKCSSAQYDPNARMPPKRGLPHQERVRPKRRAQKLRIGTINVGTMTGRGRALTELMRRGKVDIMCVQETRWSGNKSKELGDGYKLIYGSANLDKRNGVGIIVSERIKSAVSKTGCTEDEKMSFGQHYRMNLRRLLKTKEMLSVET